MRASFQLGRTAGIRISVNWSVLVIFVLIACDHDGVGGGGSPVQPRMSIVVCSGVVL